MTEAVASLPLLLATGQHDRIISPARLASVAASFGDQAGTTVELPGCGHLSHEEQPELLLHCLVPFAMRAFQHAAQSEV